MNSWTTATLHDHWSEWEPLAVTQKSPFNYTACEMGAQKGLPWWTVCHPIAPEEAVLGAERMTADQDDNREGPNLLSHFRHHLQLP